MIVVTGACGFIGSCMIAKLNFEKRKDIVAVDLFSRPDEICLSNIENKDIALRIDKDDFLGWLDDNYTSVDYVIHMGGISSTTVFDAEMLKQYNTNYSMALWHLCAKYFIPLIYASSAATYGSGENGYSDDEILIPTLKPLNPYGKSKQDFDVWCLKENDKPPFWYGLKFFNVYGPNEYHKGSMASIVLHAYEQIMQTKKLKLFKSYREDIPHGQQKRDFVYIDDVVDIMYWLMENNPKSGIYNVGTGTARSYFEIAKIMFAVLKLPPKVVYIDMPEEIKAKYQYFTQADMKKLRDAGYKGRPTSLRNGINDYISKYLIPHFNTQSD